MPVHPRSYETGAAIRSALCRFHRRSEEVCRRHGLTEDQFTLLLMIEGEDGAASTVSQLAQRLALAQNGVAERVGRAEAAGLIVREPSPHDRRSSLLRLTGDGRRRLALCFGELGREADLLVESIAEVDGRARDGGALARG